MANETWQFLEEFEVLRHIYLDQDCSNVACDTSKNYHYTKLSRAMRACSNVMFSTKIVLKFFLYNLFFIYHALQRHNECDGISNHQPHDCLLHCLFRRRSKKTSKLSVTGLCEGNSPVTGEFPAERASDAEYVSIWWCHHGISKC